MLHEYFLQFLVWIQNIQIHQFKDTGHYAIRKGIFFYKYRILYKSRNYMEKDIWISYRDMVALEEHKIRKNLREFGYVGTCQDVGEVFDYFYRVEDTRMVYLDRYLDEEEEK